MYDWKEELIRLNVEVEASIKRFAGKEERYIKYLRLFGEDRSFEKLIDALEASEISEAFERCHTLKGLVSNLGFSTMMPAIYEATEILRRGETEGVIALLDSISDNYYGILNVINSLL